MEHAGERPERGQRDQIRDQDGTCTHEDDNFEILHDERHAENVKLTRVVCKFQA